MNARIKELVKVAKRREKLPAVVRVKDYGTIELVDTRTNEVLHRERPTIRQDLETVLEDDCGRRHTIFNLRMRQIADDEEVKERLMTPAKKKEIERRGKRLAAYLTGAHHALNSQMNRVMMED